MKKSILFITTGIPACSKSQFYKSVKCSHDRLKLPLVYISVDEIRKELFGDENIQFGSDWVFYLAKKRTEKALREMKDVFLDVTFIKKSWQTWAIELGKKLDAIIVGIVFPCSISCCSYA